MKKRIISLILCICLMMSLFCYVSNADESALITGITTSGFTVDNFSSSNDYYLVYPTTFSGLKITGVNLSSASASYSISVEQYCGYTYTYTVGNTLNLGYGRAKITIKVTDGSLSKKYDFFLTDPNQKNYSFAFVQKSSVPIKTSASSSASNLTTLSSNSWVYYLNSKTNGFYKVQLCSGTYKGSVGFVATSNCFIGFESCDMPIGYSDKIAALKEAHPNWNFKFVNMGISIDEYAQKVKSSTVSNYDGTGDTSLEKIKYYMDPINFLNEQRVFMFLNVRNIEGEFTSAGVQGLWTEKTNGLTDAKAGQYFMNAYKSLGINPYFATSRAGLESGWGTTVLATGSVSGYSGYYNFYGIGAVDSNPTIGGASYAKERNWNTKERAIIEGANWIKYNYIDRLQNSIYFFRYFPVTGRDWHIYMSDICAPHSESRLLYNAYNSSGKINTNIEFIIPVYSDYLNDNDVVITDNETSVYQSANLSSAVLKTAKISDRFTYFGIVENGFRKIMTTDGQIGYVTSDSSRLLAKSGSGIAQLPSNYKYFNLALKYSNLSKGDNAYVLIPSLSSSVYKTTYGTNAVDDFKELNDVASDGDTVYFGPGEQVYKNDSYKTDAVYCNNIQKVFNFKGYYSGSNAINPVTNANDIDQSLQTTITAYNNQTDSAATCLATVRTAQTQNDISWEGVYFNGTSIWDGQATDINLSVKNCTFKNTVNTTGSIYLQGTKNKKVNIDSCYFESAVAGQAVYIFNGTNDVTIQNCSLYAKNTQNNGFMVKDAPYFNLLNNTFNSTNEQYYTYYVLTTTGKTKIKGEVNILNNTMKNNPQVGIYLEMPNAGADSQNFTVNYKENHIIKSKGMSPLRLKLPASVNTLTTKININKNRYDSCNYPIYVDQACGNCDKFIDVSQNYFTNVLPSGAFIATANYGLINIADNYFGNIQTNTLTYVNSNTVKAVPFYINDKFTKRSNIMDGLLTCDYVDEENLTIADTVNEDQTTYTFDITTNFKNRLTVKRNGEVISNEAPLDYGVNNFEVTVSSFDTTVSKTYIATITRLFDGIAIVPDVTLSTVGTGQILYQNDVIEKSKSYNKGDIKVGQIMELCAQSLSGEFLYWKDNQTDKIICETANYSFKVSDRVDISAVFTTNAESRIVTYLNTNGAILKCESVPQGAYLAPPSITPSSYGYKFVGWNKTLSEIENTVGNVDVVAVYEKAEQYFSVNITSGYIKRATNEKDGQYCQLSKVYACANKPENGMKFAYWKDKNTDEILNYNFLYDFYITTDMNIEAVFVNESEPVNKSPIIKIVSTNVDIENSKLTFTSERYLPEDYVVISHGIILTNSKATASGNGFVIGGAYVLKGTASTVGNTGKYSLTKKDANDNECWFARAYLICLDENKTTNILYSEVKEETLK